MQNNFFAQNIAQNFKIFYVYRMLILSKMCKTCQFALQFQQFFVILQPISEVDTLFIYLIFYGIKNCCTGQASARHP